MTMAGYVCWKLEDVGKIVVYDAVMPSDAVFLATHTSAPIWRVEFESTAKGELCTEQDLLRHFIDTESELLFAPITGPSGRGKSHLVRWLRINIPEDQKRHVVYIPKYNTNLRGVIQQILRGLSGQRVDELNAELAKAADSVNEATAPRKLLDAIAARIEQSSTMGVLNAGGAKKHEIEQLKYAIQWLPELIRNHTFRHTLLSKESGVISRFAKEAIQGRGKGDRDEPFSFEENDLPRNVHEVSKAGDDIKKFYGHFVANRSLRLQCVHLLNEHLGPAVAEVIGLRSDKLYEILLDLRKLLLDQGKELVLLIEDFTVLQGVQKELLDALIETPVRDGKKVLCSVRVAVAVTTGRFLDDFETVLTRAKFKGFIYRLDVPYLEKEAEGKGIANREVLEFVGAYLNSTRLGQSAIDAAYSAAEVARRADGIWLKNQCEGCPHKDRCWSAFGKTSHGYGLYPFNEQALDRMIRARSGNDFDPREILGQVIRHTLDTHAQDLGTGKFPSPEYVQRFRTDKVKPVAASLESAVRGLDKDPRRLTLLEFWGGNPPSPTNLDPVIHEAFRLPPLDKTNLPTPVKVKEVEKEKPGDQKKATGSNRPPPPSPPPLWLEAIDKWKDGTANLDQDTARELRNLTAEAIKQRIDWNEWCVPSVRPAEMRFDATSVRIERAVGEGRNPPPIHIVVKPSVEAARTFQAMKWFQHHGSWKFPGGAGYLRDLSLTLDRWATQIRTQYPTPENHEATRELVDQLVEHSLFGARLLGLTGSASLQTSDLVRAVFEKAPNLSYKKAFPPSWEALEAAVVLGETTAMPTRQALLDRLLFHIGRSQGDTGKPVAIDVILVLGAVERLKKSWQLRKPQAGSPDWLAKYHDRVDPIVDPCIDAELKRLTDWSARMRALFPADQHLNEAVKQAVAAIEQADNEARANAVRRPVSGQDVVDLPELIKDLKAPTSGFGQVVALWKFIDAVETTSRGDKLKELASDRKKQMQQLDRFVTLSENFLDQTRKRVETENKMVSSAAEQLKPTLDAINNALDKIIAVLTNAGGAL